MAQQTKNANLLKFEAGDRPTDQDFIDLFDSILFLNNQNQNPIPANGLTTNKTSLLGDLAIGGNLSIEGVGNVLINGSFSSGNTAAGVTGGRISAFTALNSPPFYASSSLSEVMFSGISHTNVASIALTTELNATTSGDVKFGITNGGGFLEAQSEKIISFSTGSGNNNLVHMDANVGIGVIPSGGTNDKIGLNIVTSQTIAGTNFSKSSLLLGTTTSGIGMDPNEIVSVGNNLNIGTSDAKSINIKTNNTSDRLRILSDGKVGIGLSSPTQLFHVKGGNILLEHSANPTLTIDHTDSGKLIFNIPDSTATVTFTSETNNVLFPADFAFVTNDGDSTTKEIVRFTEVGNVGIGITPTEALHVIGNTKLVPDSDNDNFITFTSFNATQTNQHFYVGGLATWQLYSSDENFHIRRASGNPGDPANSKNFVTFRGGDDTDATNFEGVEFHVGVTGSFKGDGGDLTGLSGANFTGFVTSPGAGQVITSNLAGSQISGEDNLIFDGSKLGINVALPQQALHVIGNIMMGDNTNSGFIHHRNDLAISADEKILIVADANDTTGTGTSDIIFGYGSAVDLNSSPASTYADAFSSDLPRVEIMRIDSATNSVGIGTTSPRATLGIQFDGGHTTGAPKIANSILDLFNPLEADTDEKGSILTFSSTFEDNSGNFGKTARAAIKGGADAAGNNADGFLAFYTGEGATADGMDEHMRIDKDGNIGIGTNAPAAILDVRGDIKIGSTPTMTLFDNNDPSLGPDIQFNDSAIISAEDALMLNINSDGGTNDLFILSGGDTSAATEIARFTSDGKLGVGGVNPTAQLHIKGAGDEIIRLEDTDVDGDPFLSFFQTTTRRSFIQHADTDNKLRIASEYGDIAFEAASTAGNDSNTEYMRIKAGGNVGIGTSSPTHLLSINTETELGGTLGDETELVSLQFETANTTNLLFTGLRTKDGSDWTKVGTRIQSKVDSTFQAYIQFNGFDDTAVHGNNHGISFGTGASSTTHSPEQIIERMRIESDGKVGIGTSAPRATLGIEFDGGHVDNTVAVGIENSTLDLFNPLEANTDEKGSILTFSDRFETGTPGTFGKTTRAAIKGGTDTIGNTADGFLAFYTDASTSNTMPERMRINHEGKVGIGTTTPSYNLHIANTNDASIYLEADTDNDLGEDHNPFLKMTQDGGSKKAILGIVGNGDKDPENESYAGTTQNSTLLGTQSDHDLIFGTDSIPRMMIERGGCVSLGLEAATTAFVTPAVDVNGDDDSGNGAAPLLLLKSLFEGDADSGNHLGTYGGGIRFIDNNTDNYFDQAFINDHLYFSFKDSGNTSADSVHAIIDNTYSETFTGQHLNLPSTGDVSDYNDKIGYIVVSTGIYNNVNSNHVEVTIPTINEALPKVKLSEEPNDKKVFGVISNAEDPNEGTRNEMRGNTICFVTKLDDRLIINSIGEGAVMVCNMNGNLENGDYITTSHIEGLGMRQDDDLLHNYTVAKITQDCDFASGTTNVTHNGVTYQTKLVGCTYHCG